jgi:hypothetical protein
MPTVSISIAKPASGQERHRRVVGADDVQAAATEKDSGEDLADHDRYERSPAGRKQRADQTGSHDQCKVAEAHQASVRAGRNFLLSAPAGTVGRSTMEARSVSTPDERGSSGSNTRLARACRPPRVHAAT